VEQAPGEAAGVGLVPVDPERRGEPVEEPVELGLQRWQLLLVRG